MANMNVDIANLLKDKRGLLEYLVNMIMSSDKFMQNLPQLRERGWTEKGMLDKVIEITAIQSNQLKHLALIALLIVQSRDFDTNVALLMNKMGRGDEALQILMRNKMEGKE